MITFPDSAPGTPTSANTHLSWQMASHKNLPLLWIPFVFIKDFVLLADMKENPPKMEFLIKNCVFILTHLNFSHPQSPLHLMQYTYQDSFFHCSRQFLNLSILMPFSASDIFCFTSPTLAKHYPWRTFFHPRKQKKKLLREGGAQ